MLEPRCEDIQRAVAAARDEEPAELDEAVVRRHLSSCEVCRAAIAADAAVRAALAGRRRAVPPAPSVWPAVERALAPRPRPAASWGAAAGAAAVVVTQALVLGPGVGLGWPGRLAPLAVAVGWFLTLGTNPFRIHLGLGEAPENS